MTDRELLELAAKAAGHTIANWVETYSGASPNLHDTHAPLRWTWNPLTDDGDSLRLAVRLNLDINVCPHRTYAGVDGGIQVFENSYTDSNASTRRAIVRAAAEIGKQMP